MEELKEVCRKISILLDKEFPNQKYYTGVLKDIDTIIDKIYTSALIGEKYKVGINFNSLIRQFVDETTHFSSPIISELENLDQLLS